MHVKECDTWGTLCIINDDGNHVAEMVAKFRDDKGTAQKMAAAQKMYEALEKVSDWFGKLEDWSGVGDPDIDAISDAIRKARGEE